MVWSVPLDVKPVRRAGLDGTERSEIDWCPCTAEVIVTPLVVEYCEYRRPGIGRIPVGANSALDVTQLARRRTFHIEKGLYSRYLGAWSHGNAFGKPRAFRMYLSRKGHGGQTVYRTGRLKDRCDPFYCLSSVHPIFAQVHEPLISEEMWVGAAAAAIKDIGAEKFLRLLLENPKGNYIAS